MKWPPDEIDESFSPSARVRELARQVLVWEKVDRMLEEALAKAQERAALARR